MSGDVDVVYVVRDVPENEGFELRYSLRSLEAFGRGIRSVWIVGGCPVWCKPDYVVRIPDLLPNPHACTAAKVLTACFQPELSETFVVFCDDIYLTQPVDLTKLPLFYWGNLDRAILRHAGQYKQALAATQLLLLKHRYPTLNFELHVPFVVSKGDFSQTLMKFPWWQASPPLLWRSLYANALRKHGTEMKDVKIYEKDVKGWTVERYIGKAQESPFFSSDKSLGITARLALEKLYPGKSRWEAD